MEQEQSSYFLLKFIKWIALDLWVIKKSLTSSVKKVNVKFSHKNTSYSSEFYTYTYTFHSFLNIGATYKFYDVRETTKNKILSATPANPRKGTNWGTVVGGIGLEVDRKFWG